MPVDVRNKPGQDWKSAKFVPPCCPRGSQLLLASKALDIRSPDHRYLPRASLLILCRCPRRRRRPEETAGRTMHRPIPSAQLSLVCAFVPIQRSTSFRNTRTVSDDGAKPVVRKRTEMGTPPSPSCSPKNDSFQMSAIGPSIGPGGASTSYAVSVSKRACDMEHVTKRKVVRLSDRPFLLCLKYSPKHAFLLPYLLVSECALLGQFSPAFLCRLASITRISPLHMELETTSG